MNNQLSERWECNECGFPCWVEIVYNDTKLPKHLRGNQRFRDQVCVCREGTPNWIRFGGNHVARFRQEMDRILEAFDRIDREAPWSDKEPEWWLDMMKIRRLIVKIRAKGLYNRTVLHLPTEDEGGDCNDP